MGVDCNMQVKLPTGLAKEEFNKYFQHAETHDGYVCYKATEAYLDLAADSLLKDNPSLTRQQAYDYYKDCRVGYIDVGYIILSDSFRLNGGEPLLIPDLISKVFADKEIEVSMNVDVDDEKCYSIYKNGTYIKSVPEKDCELGRYNYAKDEKDMEEWLKTVQTTDSRRYGMLENLFKKQLMQN